MKGLSYFQKIIYYLSFTKHDKAEEIAAELLKELKKFEHSFA